MGKIHGGRGKGEINHKSTEENAGKDMELADSICCAVSKNDFRDRKTGQSGLYRLTDRKWENELHTEENI